MPGTGSPPCSARRTRTHSARDDDYACRESGSTGSSSSNRSDISYITSATDLATRTEDFMEWAREVKLDPIIKESIPEAAIFDPIRDLQSASKVFPRWSSKPDSPQFDFIPTAYYGLRDRLCSSLREGGWDLHDNEDLVLPSALSMVFQACHHHANILSHRDGILGNKMDMRICVDCLMIHSCEADGGEPLMYSTERRLRLPATTSNKVNVTTTTVDGISWQYVPGFGPYLWNYDFRVATSALDTDETTREIILVHCVTSYTPTGSGENRMMMGVVSALHQKRVLGIQEQFAFGVFQFRRDFLQVVAGIWQDDEMKLYKVGTYSLRVPLLLCQFYLVLRGIKRLASVYPDQLKAKDPDVNWYWALRENPPANEWEQRRALNRTLIRKLATLERWDVDERIDAYLENMRECNLPSLLHEDFCEPENADALDRH